MSVDLYPWIGWVRATDKKRAPWHAVVGAASYDLCWDRLMSYDPFDLAAHIERVVLPAGQHPVKSKRKDSR